MSSGQSPAGPPVSSFSGLISQKARPHILGESNHVLTGGVGSAKSSPRWLYTSYWDLPDASTDLQLSTDSNLRFSEEFFNDVFNHVAFLHDVAEMRRSRDLWLDFTSEKHKTWFRF